MDFYEPRLITQTSYARTNRTQVRSALQQLICHGFRTATNARFSNGNSIHSEKMDSDKWGCDLHIHTSALERAVEVVATSAGAGAHVVRQK